MSFIVLLGPPGAGKGTQAKLLSACMDMPHISTGDIFRYNLKNETELGLLAKTYMDAGDLVPDDVTVAMVRDRLSQDDCVNGALLDGFPRTETQAEALKQLLSDMNSEIAVAPHITVDHEELVTRLLKRAELEGRADDNEETIRNRMKVYHESTAPLLDYYKSEEKLVDIDGQRSIGDVFADLVSVVKSK